MDRRSWLWRRKSLEKSPSGETESSGSASSQSERFSDDQTVTNVNVQSPEVTSKAAPGDEQELDATLKTLSEKLSEALLNIRAKEELVSQHAKVAEEAVSGWERAENEVVVLKKQNDALTQKNSILEERVGHLDGALKECFRQLRQAREEQEEKIYDAIAKKSEESTKKAVLENQLVELQNQLQNTKTEADNQMLADAISKLETVEKENSILKLKLISKANELELMIHERDLTIRAAETASKQHLDSIKKVAKLEAECRRLKAEARKAATMNDYRSTTASSVNVESVTDSQSDCGERALFIGNDSCKCESFDNEPCNPNLVQRRAEKTVEKGLVVSSFGINMMDDFLEMERLAALSETRGGGDHRNCGEIASRDEMEALVNRLAELEDNLKKISAEKANLEIALDECQMQLQASDSRCQKTEVELADLKTQLALANGEREKLEEEAERTKVKLETSATLLDKAEANLLSVQVQLEKANEAKNAVEDANRRKEKAESQLKEMELELDSLQSTIHSLKKEVEKERNSSREAAAKCKELEAEISKMKLDYQSQRSAMFDDFRINQDKELAVAAGKFAACQETIASLGRQLKSLATLEDLLMESEVAEHEHEHEHEQEA